MNHDFDESSFMSCFSIKKASRFFGFAIFSLVTLSFCKMESQTK